MSQFPTIRVDADNTHNSEHEVSVFCMNSFMCSDISLVY